MAHVCYRFAEQQQNGIGSTNQVLLRSPGGSRETAELCQHALQKTPDSSTQWVCAHHPFFLATASICLSLPIKLRFYGRCENDEAIFIAKLQVFEISGCLTRAVVFQNSVHPTPGWKLSSWSSQVVTSFVKHPFS